MRRHPADVRLLLRENEGDARSAAARSARAAYTVDVARAVGGRIEVDHVRDLDEIEAPSSELRRNERWHVAGAEPLERPLALLCGMSPCIAAAGTSRCESRRASRSAPRFVRTKTSESPSAASR